MTNKLYVGFSKSVELPIGGCLFIHDGVPDVPRARVFDPAKHCFNPLADITYKKARELAELLYGVAPDRTHIDAGIPKRPNSGTSTVA